MEGKEKRGSSSGDEGNNYELPGDPTSANVPLGMRAIMRVVILAPRGESGAREQISLGAARRIRDVLESLGHQVSVSVDVALLKAWFASMGGEPPEVILIDTGNAKNATETNPAAEAARQMRAEKRFRDIPIIAVLPARARPEAYEALRLSEVDDFLRDDSPEGEIKSRLDMAGHVLRLRGELAATRDQLQRQTRVDEVTGVMSRRFFFQQAHRECSRARRYNSSLSCLMVEIDYYRLLNSKFGYVAGDWVLRTVADCLGQWTRDCDLVARFAENKFAILLPETSIAGATQAREKIQAALTAQNWECEGKVLPVTVSIGEAELQYEPLDEASTNEDSASNDSLSTREALAELLQDADAALFIAKKGAKTPEVFVPYTLSPDAGQWGSSKVKGPGPA